MLGVQEAGPLPWFRTTLKVHPSSWAPCGIRWGYQQGFLGSSNGKESACKEGDLGSIPGLGRSSGEGHGDPLQYSCLENSMDRGAWRANTTMTPSCIRVQLLPSLSDLLKVQFLRGCPISCLNAPVRDSSSVPQGTQPKTRGFQLKGTGGITRGRYDDTVLPPNKRRLLACWECWASLN